MLVAVGLMLLWLYVTPVVCLRLIVLDMLGLVPLDMICWVGLVIFCLVAIVCCCCFGCCIRGVGVAFLVGCICFRFSGLGLLWWLA